MSSWPNDGPALPIKDRHLCLSHLIGPQSAEEEYPEDRSPAELGHDPPDSTEKPWWADLIKEGRRARGQWLLDPRLYLESIPPMIVYDRARTVTPPTRGAPVLSPKNSAPSAPSAVKPDPAPI